MSNSQAYASAVERAKQITSKLHENQSNVASNQAGMKRTAPGYDNSYQTTEKRPFLNDKSASAAAAEAVARLNQKLGVPQQSMPQNYPQNQYNGSSAVNTMPSATQSISITIPIPDRLVGLIIGKRGEQITSLQAESNCKVQITQEQTGPERPITLTGTAQQIEHARRIISDLIARAERGGPPQIQQQHPAGGDNYTQIELMVPGNKAGLIIGKGGETIKSLQEEHSVKMVLIQQNNQASTEDKPLRISGDGTRVERVRKFILDLINSKTAPGMNFGGAVSGQDFQRFAVPAEKAGLVIGKGGETIKEICKLSNCHVEISKDAPPSPALKLFNIRGNPEDIVKAKKYISERAGIPQTSQEGYGSNPGYNVYTYMQDPSAQQQTGMPAPSINPYTGLPDYSAAWIEYYRRLGMPEQAEKIALQAQQQGIASQGGAAPSAASYAAQPTSAAPTAAPGQATPGMDYSQWQAWQSHWQAWQQQQPQGQWAAATNQGLQQTGQGH